MAWYEVKKSPATDLTWESRLRNFLAKASKLERRRFHLPAIRWVPKIIA